MLLCLMIGVHIYDKNESRVLQRLCVGIFKLVLGLELLPLSRLLLWGLLPLPLFICKVEMGWCSYCWQWDHGFTHIVA